MTQTIRQYTTKNDVDIQSATLRHQGFLKVMLYKLRFRTFEGHWTQVLSRELLEKNSAVGVLLYDSNLQKVVLLEQFRPGSLNDEKSPWQIEIAAGLMDTEETETEVAIRETKEETGLFVRELKSICRYWVSPGASNERMSVYCGLVDASQANGIHGLAEEGENIKVHVVDVKEAFHWLDTGLINNAAAIIALQWLRVQRSTIPLQVDNSGNL